MAYDLKQDVRVVAAGSLGTAGDIGKFTCLRPYVVRSFGVLPVGGSGTFTVNVALDLRPTAGSDAGRAEKARANASSVAVGKLVYKDGLNVPVNPGNELVVKVVGTAAGITADVWLLLEPIDENFANLANTIPSTM